MEEIIKKVIHLAKLNFSSEELENFIGECKRIVNYFQELKKILKEEENEKEEKEDYKGKSLLREDIVKLTDRNFLKSLPNFKGNYFRIKKIL
ncbi:MAG: aspartyl/glutamyl-tRNA amidotransferase subunit C [candidate division WOR-3 bacterium]|nr:aspartyl/glutamyl-tRNA amidotransferase subunit C [candidate division WOR-3 bacterium]MCX7837378.1 aspartyl/glutamyl-tRNA amidotransferase subunit C [candidate division WOR-3 bacterium]MDW8114007.1 Asp-tRNA(Asn)/Glu-tRNA(Gln) amidotransferase subunit GatC [candidate division WOR-3 bacterium]